jgi:hypothetical protein
MIRPAGFAETQADSAARESISRSSAIRESSSTVSKRARRCDGSEMSVEAMRSVKAESEIEDWR